VSKQCIVGVVLQTCVVRAWDPKKPLLFAPAMNTLMLQQASNNSATDKCPR